jgi:ribosome-associated heat shock protein Hsp15
MTDPVRIDKWLWAARFFKTRSLATDAVDSGRIKLNNERCKPARMVHIDDLIDVDNGSMVWQVKVVGLSGQRGSATLARLLYLETEQSVQKRQQESEQRKIFFEPGAEIKGRPTKRDRRMLDRSRS